MDKKIWEYNPLNPQQLKDYDVSSYCYRHSRRDWKVSAFDKGYGINYDGDSRKPEYLIDGDLLSATPRTSLVPFFIILPSKATIHSRD